MADVAALLQSIASLLWPLLAFVTLHMFKSQIGELLLRLRKGKLLGQEIELSASLTRLELSATAAETEVAALPASTMETSPRLLSEGVASIDRVLNLAAQSPKAALLVLASELEREVRRMLATMGLLQGRRTIPIQQALAELDRFGLPGHVPSSLRLFWDVRSRLVHGHEASEGDTLSAIDSGIAILRALNAIPHEVNVVHHPGVTIYSDAACNRVVPDVKGVMLETTSPSGASRSLRIYPSTRTHFVKGMRVAWEWSDERTFDRAWYKHPDDGHVAIAWESSMEFVGRNLDEL